MYEKRHTMPQLVDQLLPENQEWRQLCKKLESTVSLTALVLTAWQMGLLVAKAIVEQQLAERAQVPTAWNCCSVCGTQLVSKGLAKRQMLTLIGKVQWRRRIGRCPHRCLGSQQAPFDATLDIDAHQQTSTEVMRLGCLLAVFLPFDLAASVLQQLTGITVSEDAIWNWVQIVGQQAKTQLETQLQDFSNEGSVPSEALDSKLKAMPLLIAADGVTVPFRAQPKTSKGFIVWREVKVALFARLGKHQTQEGKIITRLHQRRLVAVLGDIDDFKPRLQLEAHQQGIDKAPQAAWISDGARGFWRLYRECFSERAVGILDFYHAAQHLWKAASVYQDGNPNRTPQNWFEGLRHRLRHGFVKPLIRELHRLSLYNSTSDAARPVLRQVRDYLKGHLNHIQYRTFKKLGLPIGSGMVESACKWLIQQRFKGVGMCWSEDGFNHLLHLRLAWVNQRFDALFSDENLSLRLYSPDE